MLFLAHSGQMMFSPSWEERSSQNYLHLRSKPYLDESLANHGDLALVTKEALIVPGQGLKSHKLCAAQTSFAWEICKY